MKYKANPGYCVVEVVVPQDESNIITAHAEERRSNLGKVIGINNTLPFEGLEGMYDHLKVGMIVVLPAVGGIIIPDSDLRIYEISAIPAYAVD